MKLEIDQTFEEFSADLTAKVEALRALPNKTLNESRSEVRRLRVDSFLASTVAFPLETRQLLNHHGLITKFGELGQKLEAHLRANQISYNIFVDLSILQIISPDLVLHEHFADSEFLAEEYFGIFRGSKHYDLLMGFCEEPRANEVLQLVFYTALGVSAD